jgi:hypothetical protein
LRNFEQQCGVLEKWNVCATGALDPFPFVTDIAVAGSDVYVSGYRSDSTVFTYNAGFWKNGSFTKLSRFLSYTSGIAVSGSDVYVAGNYNTPTSYFNGYWKNAVFTSLSNSIAVGSIETVGSDIYLPGILGQVVAGYWKNGVQNALTTAPSSAIDISISGLDVYVAGQVLSLTQQGIWNAAYWKNGQSVTLTTESSSAVAIVVK